MIDSIRNRKIRQMVRRGELGQLKVELASDLDLHFTTSLGSWLHIAAMRQQYDVAKWLVDRGIDINAKTGGMYADTSALTLAAREGSALERNSTLPNRPEIHFGEPS